MRLVRRWCSRRPQPDGRLPADEPQPPHRLVPVALIEANGHRIDQPRIVSNVVAQAVPQGITTSNSLLALAKWPRTVGLPMFDVMVAETV